MHNKREIRLIHAVHDVREFGFGFRVVMLVTDKPNFKSVALAIDAFLEGCDLAGYNSMKFDLPLLVEEFMRSGVEFDYAKRRMVDAQKIFHHMEPRTLSAAFKFYCGREMAEDPPQRLLRR